MIRVRITPRQAVDAQLRVRLHASTGEAWRAMQRFSKLLAADPYHTRVTDRCGRVLEAVPPRGTRLVIGHGIGFTVFERFGAVVYVKEGVGFVFTDLSKRGRNVGFPHVFKYTLKPVDQKACELVVTVRGRWSLRWCPRAIGCLWLWWVMAQAKVILQAHMRSELRLVSATSAHR